MKNNKGFTVVELIASFALTMVITVFLFEVLIEVKDIFADTSVKTAIQQKGSIISKNIRNVIPTDDASIRCTNTPDLGSCDINGQNVQIDKANNRVVVNGQNFNMPDSVSIKSYILNNACRDTNCYLHTQMTLDSGNLKKQYNYDVTYYYYSSSDYELLLNPTFMEEPTSDGKNITIYFPVGCEGEFVCTYQKNNGEIVTVTEDTIKEKFTENGNIIATVNDGEQTISSSYNVNGIVALSTGTVKGGKSEISKTKAIDDETITFTAQADNTFTYKGATVVCENGTQYTVSGSDKSFKITDERCSSAVLYPSWQKNEKVIMALGSTPANPTFSQALSHVSGTGKYIANDGTYRYYLQLSNPQGSWSRVQMSTDSKVNITEYSAVYIDTWCTATNTTMMVGITQNRNTWMSHPNGGTYDDKVGVHVQKGNVTTNASANERISCNIEKYTGDWYIGVQRVYTNSNNSNYCNINRVGLTGMTYSYKNRGV